MLVSGYMLSHELICVHFFVNGSCVAVSISFVCLSVQEWAFLFGEAGMTGHFQELTGVKLMESFLGNVEKKEAHQLHF